MNRPSMDRAAIITALRGYAIVNQNSKLALDVLCLDDLEVPGRAIADFDLTVSCLIEALRTVRVAADRETEHLAAQDPYRPVMVEHHAEHIAFLYGLGVAILVEIQRVGAAQANACAP